MTRVRWGVIGLGRIAHSFASDIASVANAELVGVAARNGDRAEKFARRYNVPKAYAGYEDLYSDPDIDAVYVATPHNHHLQNCSDILRAGKAVLCEKPLVLTPTECQQLMAIAEATGGYLMEGMWTWYLPAIRRALGWVEAGRIGDILHIKADFGYPFTYSEELREYDASLGASVTLEMGIYPIAIARLFMGRSPTSIQVSGRRAPNGVEDDLTAILDYGDAMATLGTSFRCKLQNCAYIIGTEGYIAIPDFWGASECGLYAVDTRIDHFSESRGSFGYNYQIGEVSADIIAGRTQSPVIPLATSLALQEDMLAIRDAVPRLVQA